MTPAQLQTLHDYIVATPALNNIPNTPDGNYKIAEILNTPSNPGWKAISVGSAMLWAAEGPRVRIGSAANDPQQPEAVRASCQTFLDLIVSGTDSLVHTEDPEIKALFDSWLSASIITLAEHNQIYGVNGLAATLIPQSIELVGQTVTYIDVQEARAL
jgi:hypothetical protein